MKYSRTTLSLITIAWIIVALLVYPYLYLLLSFAQDNPSVLGSVASVCLLLFYFQMIVQAFIAYFSLKRIVHLGQYLVAIVLILVLPLLLCLAGLLLEQLWSDPGFTVTWGIIASIFIFHVIASIWLWVLIATRGSKPRPTLNRSKKATTHNDHTRIMLYSPVIVIIFGTLASVLLEVVTSLAPSLRVGSSSIPQFIFDLVGGCLIASLVAFCIGGIKYIFQRKH